MRIRRRHASLPLWRRASGWKAGGDAILDPHHAAAALRWWSEAGVEFAVEETPRNHFADVWRPAPYSKPVLPQKAPAEAPIGAPVARERGDSERARVEIAARDLAASAPDLSTLRSHLESFEQCGLKRTATQLVFADGAPGSRVMFVGEAPGADEDRIGRPFVGRAGQLLDRMLKAIGLDRGQVYIANVVPWRPPGNRTPTLQETEACLPFIKRQIELAEPLRSSFVWAHRRPKRYLAYGKELPVRAGHGLPIAATTGGRCARWRCSILPICCDSPGKRGKPGPICGRSRERLPSERLMEFTQTPHFCTA